MTDEDKAEMILEDKVRSITARRLEQEMEKNSFYSYGEIQAYALLLIAKRMRPTQ